MKEFRFYFHFIAPQYDELTYRPERVLPLIREGLRAFVGGTAFEELSRQWVNIQGRAGQLPFEPEEVGGHWSRGVQVDVVATDSRQRAILLGQCKWGGERVGRALLRELVETKTPRVLAALPDKGTDWTVHYAFFARAGFTEAAQAEAEQHQVTLVDLKRLDTDLREA